MWKNAKIIGTNQQRIEPTFKRGDPRFQMSRSELMDFAVCPAKWIDKPPDEEATDSMQFGTVVDALVTATKDQFDARFAITPETYRSSKGEQKPWTRRANTCKEWEAEQKNAGKIVVTQQLLEEAKLAAAALAKSPEALSLLLNSDKQVLITAEWHDKNGIVVPFSCLLDLVPHKSSEWGKCLGDLKTARSGDPAKWPRACEDGDYHVQAASYYDVYRAAMPDEDRTNFIHLIQENTAPYHVVTPLTVLSTEFLDWGRMKYRRALAFYCECLKENVWPSYQPARNTIGKFQIIGPEDLWTYKSGDCMREARTLKPAEPELPSIGNIDPKDGRIDINT